RASLLGAILKDTPPRVSSVQPVSPPALDRVIATCLEKDPDDRYQSARDLLRELKWVAAGADAGAPATQAPPARSARLQWIVTGLFGLATIVVAGRALLRPAPARDLIQFTIPPPDNAAFSATNIGGGTGTVPQLAISPDGRHLAFVATSQGITSLWL